MCNWWPVTDEEWEQLNFPNKKVADDGAKE